MFMEGNQQKEPLGCCGVFAAAGHSISVVCQLCMPPWHHVLCLLAAVAVATPAWLCCACSEGMMCGAATCPRWPTRTASRAWLLCTTGWPCAGQPLRAQTTSWWTPGRQHSPATHAHSRSAHECCLLCSKRRGAFDTSVRMCISSRCRHQPVSPTWLGVGRSDGLPRSDWRQHCID
jgi:hypothetical protein